MVASHDRRRSVSKTVAPPSDANEPAPRFLPGRSRVAVSRGQPSSSGACILQGALSRGGRSAWHCGAGNAPPRSCAMERADPCLLRLASSPKAASTASAIAMCDHAVGWHKSLERSAACSTGE